MTLEEVRARHEEAKRMYGSNLNRAERDREFLLAEVDRLTTPALAALDAIAAAYDANVAASNARIAELTRRPPLGGIEQFQDEDR